MFKVVELLLGMARGGLDTVFGEGDCYGTSRSIGDWHESFGRVTACAFA